MTLPFRCCSLAATLLLSGAALASPGTTPTQATAADPWAEIRAIGAVTEVARKQGWMPDGSLRFGEFQTSAMDQSATVRTRETTGQRDKEHAHADLRFTLSGPANFQASVQARSELLREEQRPTVDLGGNSWLGDVVRWARTEVLADRNQFAGTIRVGAGEAAQTWEFTLNDPNESPRAQPERGSVRSSTGDTWYIHAIHSPTTTTDPRMPDWSMPRAPIGFVVLHDAKPLAGLRLGNPAQIVLGSNLTAQSRTALAALLSAILSRTPLTRTGTP